MTVAGDWHVGLVTPTANNEWWYALDTGIFDGWTIKTIFWVMPWSAKYREILWQYHYLAGDRIGLEYTSMDDMDRAAASIHMAAEVQRPIRKS